MNSANENELLSFIQLLTHKSWSQIFESFWFLLLFN